MFQNVYLELVFLSENLYLDLFVFCCKDCFLRIGVGMLWYVLQEHTHLAILSPWTGFSISVLWSNTVSLLQQSSKQKFYDVYLEFVLS